MIDVQHLQLDQIEIERRKEINQSDCKIIEVISTKISDPKEKIPGVKTLWLEVIKGLFEAWRKSFINNTPEGLVHSPENTVSLLNPWIKRLLKMDILEKTNNLTDVEAFLPGSIKICAESFNDCAVALSEKRPISFDNLQEAAFLISLSRKLLDRKIYEKNQKIIETQIKSFHR